MKKILSLFLKVSLVMVIVFNISCEDAIDATEDTLALTALRNVDFSYDSLSVNISFPEGAVESGKTFQELLDEYPEIYSDPANYTISLSTFFLADNTSNDARDAKFDGTNLNIVMDTIYSNPIQAISGPFDIKTGEIKTVDISGMINLETHRMPCLYMFRQTVDGNDLSTRLQLSLLYTIASESGSINLPEFHQIIPTRASDETKAFLSGLLDSGVFDNPED